MIALGFVAQTGWRKARRPRLLGTALSVAGLVNLLNCLVAGVAPGLLNADLTWSIVVGCVVAVVTVFGVVIGRIGRRGVAPIGTRYPRKQQ